MFFLKGLELSLIKAKQGAMTVEKISNRLRKRYQFNAPNEVYLQKLNSKKAFAFVN